MPQGLQHPLTKHVGDLHPAEPPGRVEPVLDIVERTNSAQEDDLRIFHFKYTSSDPDMQNREPETAIFVLLSSYAAAMVKSEIFQLRLQ